MTTSTDQTSVEAIAAPARLDATRAAALTYDAPLDDAIAYLRELSNADEATFVADHITSPDVRAKIARLELQMALSALTHLLTTGIDAVVRAAPPSGLAEVVRDAMQSCDAPTCTRSLAPWNGSTCDDPECRTEAARAFGDDR